MLASVGCWLLAVGCWLLAVGGWRMEDGGCEEVGVVCFSQSRVAFALFSYFYEQNWTECRIVRQHGDIRRLTFTLRIFWTVELDKETQQKSAARPSQRFAAFFATKESW
ncbi:hypothetical protein FCV66_12610 [Enterovibrio norvegicus]|nr:hypothetical protein FCV66_12610 [Enterovibrio norvegicus]